MYAGHAYRRHLPHFQNERRTYFVTFVTRERWILPPCARDVVLAELRALHQQLAYVHAAVVMPDHVHVVFTPLCDRHGYSIALSRILQTIKGRTARFINKTLSRSGRVWQEESFDVELRTDESLHAKCEYVRDNPVRKGLVLNRDDYEWQMEAGLQSGQPG